MFFLILETFCDFNFEWHHCYNARLKQNMNGNFFLNIRYTIIEIKKYLFIDKKGKFDTFNEFWTYTFCVCSSLFNKEILVTKINVLVCVTIDVYVT